MDDIVKWAAVPILRFQDHYMVSSLGQVKSLRRNKVMVASDRGNGYLAVPLCVNGYQKSCSVHNPVAGAFLGPANGLQVCHNNGDRHDNRLENLRYGTAKENFDDSVHHGRKYKGFHSVKSKMTPELIAEIKASTEQQRVLAKRLGLSQSTVWRIKHGKSHEALQ